MNSIDVRMEKANAIFRYQSFQRITTLFRFMEICVFLVVISTFSSQLPFSVRTTADYFRGISFGGISPRFVFVIGNVIILILLFKSRVAENGDPYGKIDVYDECVKRCEKSAVNRTSDIVAVPERKIYRSQSEKVMSVECRDSQNRRKLTRSVTERKLLKNVGCCGGETPPPEICRSQSEKVMSVEFEGSRSHRKLTRSVTERLTEICRSQPEKVMSVECEDSQSHRKLTRSVTERLPEICRSQSEKVMRVECKDSQSHRKLTRSVTEREMLKNVDCCGGETAAPESCGVDKLSSEAFRRTVEAFIEKQQRSLRDEELAPVPYVCA